MHQVYDAVRTSASPTGSNAMNTLLLLTFDEHGGCYDHVAPPVAVPPDPSMPVGEKDFKFDRLGVRVPMIAVSAYTEANTVINRTVHHGSFAKMLCTKYDLPYLTERDHNAPDMSDALNLTTPRPASTWPVTVPRPVPPELSETNPLAAGLAPCPLNDLEQALVGLAMAYFQRTEPTADTIPKTKAEAYALLQQLAQGKFGK